MPKEELRGRLGLPARLFNQLLDRLAANGSLVQSESSVRRAAHRPTFDPAQRQKVDRLLAALGQSRFSPPSLSDLAQELALDAELIGALVEQRRIVRLNESVAYLPDAYDEVVARIVGRLRETGSVTVAEVRDLFDTSRKYALAIMEHLDEERITRRVGDSRVLR